jgi:hypothetical protein
MPEQDSRELSEEVTNLLTEREEIFKKLGNAEIDVAKYRSELADLRTKLLKVNPEIAMRIISTDSW